MKIIFLLHFYQPHDQQDDILERIVNESYRPLIAGLLSNEGARVVVNVSGVLLDLLVKKGYTDIIDDLRKLLERGQVEMTGSSMYHAFLPLIPDAEVVRQIELNTEFNKEVFGDAYAPVGFFSPEMAFSDNVLRTVEKMGYKWIAAPQLARKEGAFSADRFFVHKEHPETLIMLRNKRVSSLILSSVVRDAESLIKETKDLQEKDDYWFCVMDAETFGHHRIGHEEVLLDILQDDFFKPTLVSDLLGARDTLQVKETELRNCTWTNTEQDFHLDEDKNSFVLWQDPDNPIHKLQWDLTGFVIDQVENYEDKDSKEYKNARGLLDKAIASDQFWWASVKPWWSLEMVESGAYALKEVIEVLNPSEGAVKRADRYYRDILDKAFYWQRSGIIRQKHLENSATYMKEPFRDRTPHEWYNQIILEFEGEINKAVERKEFEKAIKWRDAVIKLERGTDIYDVLHVVDELWSARRIPEIKPFLEHNWDELSDFAKKYLQDVKTEEELEQWKKNKSTS